MQFVPRPREWSAGSFGGREFARGPRGLSVFTSLHSALYFVRIGTQMRSRRKQTSNRECLMSA
jgi:hypothetical protein